MLIPLKEIVECDEVVHLVQLKLFLYNNTILLTFFDWWPCFLLDPEPGAKIKNKYF